MQFLALSIPLCPSLSRLRVKVVIIMMITIMIKILRLGHLPVEMVFTRSGELYLLYLEFGLIGKLI